MWVVSIGGVVTQGAMLNWYSRQRLINKSGFGRMCPASTTHPHLGGGVVSYGYFWNISTISSKGGMQLAQFCEMIAMIVIFVKAADKMMTKNQAVQSNWSTALCSSYSLSFSQILFVKTCTALHFNFLLLNGI